MNEDGRVTWIQVHVLKVVETVATAVSLLKDLDTLVGAFERPSRAPARCRRYRVWA